MGVLAQWKGKRASRGGAGGPKPGKGEVLLKDVKVIDTYGETHRFVLEVYTTSSQSTETENGVPVAPDAPGASWAVLESLNMKEGALGRALGFIGQLLGAEGDAMSDDELLKQLESIARLGDDGRTDPKKGPCSLRGVPYSYETKKKPIKSGANKDKKMDIPRFTLKDVPDSQIQANRKLLDGAGADANVAF
jgi:hypothetical protein